jgi:O-antigen/teichoic acid export membrane protein
VRDPLRRGVISGSLWATTAKFLAVIAGFLLYFVLARVLEPAAFGGFVVAQSLVVGTSILATAGLDRVAGRAVAVAANGGDGATLDATTVRVVVLTLAFGLLVGAGVAWGVLALGGIAAGLAPLRSAALWLVPWIALHAYQRSTAEILRGYLNVAAATFLSGVVTNALAIGGLLVGAAAGVAWSLPWTLALMTGAAAVNAGILATVLVLERSNVADRAPQVGTPAPATRLTDLLAQGGPILVVSAMAFLTTQSDLWILAAFGRPDEVAQYGASLRIVTLVGMPAFILQGVLPPYFAALHAQRRMPDLETLLRGATTVLAVPIVLMVAAVVAFAPTILTLVFGEFFGSAAGLLRILVLGTLGAAAAGLGGSALIMSGEQGPLSRVTFVASALTIAIGIVAVNVGGVGALAATMAAGQLLQSVLVLMLVRRRLGLRGWPTVRPALVRRAMALRNADIVAGPGRPAHADAAKDAAAG